LCINKNMVRGPDVPRMDTITPATRVSQTNSFVEGHQTAQQENGMLPFPDVVPREPRHSDLNKGAIWTY
jgi:hypothetical protein